MLSDAQIQKFQDIYYNRFGKEIDRAEALDKAIRLVGLIKTICQPENNNLQNFNE